MTKLFLKNMPKLKLSDLLRRRKMTLKRFLGEFGITTHEGLVIRCNSMGVLPPTLEDFKLAFDTGPVNNPTEGVIVLEPPPVIDDLTGRKIDPEAPVLPGVVVITDVVKHDEPAWDMDEALSVEPTEPTQKKPRKKKEATQGE